MISTLFCRFSKDGKVEVSVATAQIYFLLVISVASEIFQLICDSVGRIAQSVEHQNGNPKVPDSSPGTAVQLSYPETFGGQCDSRTVSVCMKEYSDKYFIFIYLYISFILWHLASQLVIISVTIIIKLCVLVKYFFYSFICFFILIFSVSYLLLWLLLSRTN